MSPMPRRLALILCLALFSGASLVAREAVRSAPSASDPAAYQQVQVAEGIHAFLTPEGVTPIVSGNTILIVGDDGVVEVGCYTCACQPFQAYLPELKAWTPVLPQLTFKDGLTL